MYQVETRYAARETFYVVVRTSTKQEMAPVFMYKLTAEEICWRANQGQRFFDKIPLVPYDTPIPRPQDIKVQVP